MASELGMALRPTSIQIDLQDGYVLAPFSHLLYLLHNAKDNLQARKSFTISIQPATQAFHHPGLFSLWFDLMNI